VFVCSAWVGKAKLIANPTMAPSSYNRLQFNFQQLPLLIPVTPQMVLQRTDSD
jgi:hypothetical protein